MPLDRQLCYRALRARDARFDGRFFTAVRTTGIYCRPICPAQTPKLEHIEFFASAAAAHEAGFRPCLRCRPEVSPRFAAWRGTWNTVARALLLIDQGALDTGDVEALATRLGMGDRHLRRLFDKHLGAPPVAVAQTRRLQLAKQLLDETTLPVSHIAYSAGFGSVRRFNDVIRRTYDRSPSDIRKLKRGAMATRQEHAAPDAEVTIKMPFAPPYYWEGLLAFLAGRAIPGVEVVDGDTYRRSIQHDGAAGIVDVRPMIADGYLLATIRFPSIPALGLIVERLRHLFDVGADPVAITKTLRADPRLADIVAQYPGIRVPGAWDGFELAVRAVLGQQVSVRSATGLAGKLVATYGTALPDAYRVGGITHLFPTAATLASISSNDLASAIGVPKTRANAIVSIARAVRENAMLLSPGVSLDDSVSVLTTLPGIGDWTAQYIAMRALREPDAFPASDLVLRQSIGGATAASPAEAVAAANGWRPWRAYAAMLLWTARSHEPAWRLSIEGNV